MKKTIQFLGYIMGAITIIGAISTTDAVFVVAGVISIFPFAKKFKEFIDENGGPLNDINQ